MSTALYIAAGLVVLALIIGVFRVMWKVSRWLVFPIQVILFIVLIVIVVKITATPDNVDRVKGIVEDAPAPVQKAVSGTAKSGKGMLERLKDDINNQSAKHNDGLSAEL